MDVDAGTYVSREAYRRWARAQPRGRFERVDGRVIRMPAEQLGHALLKSAIWEALKHAIGVAGVQGEALPDGMTVEVGPDTDYEPDAMVYLGPRPPVSTVAIANPVIVVEVLSPGPQRRDRRDKLEGYFRVPSIMHYLVVSGLRRQVTHHRRTADGVVASVVTAGEIALDPPGIAISVDQIYTDSGL